MRIMVEETFQNNLLDGQDDPLDSIANAGQYLTSF